MSHSFSVQSMMFSKKQPQENEAAVLIGSTVRKQWKMNITYQFSFTFLYSFIQHINGVAHIKVDLPTSVNLIWKPLQSQVQPFASKMLPYSIKLTNSDLHTLILRSILTSCVLKDT